MSTFTEDQLRRYFDHIALPQEKRTSAPTLDFLTELVRRQLATVPFESLTLHYSQHHLLSLEPNDLFKKVVSRNMGGYCMENNTFFGIVLRSIGFKLINAGARVSDATAGRPGGGYMGWQVFLPPHIDLQHTKANSS
jgi:arylamine N-acetyltransferase